ncbi:hypothetical protein E5Q_01814 [Mixia osmundae IAM 14324]|uniref:Uncharacterized protein n=1 Tax=Mixia osmundae (strain CBS 9802 / IAM 14324 / JCM 22182 / KY 12970) TaxID=764103 RepID=G7DWP7_MIXOS|nr:hypothetical protein E5Q_01814 [Mixia osmundae IAM 14324]
MGLTIPIYAICNIVRLTVSEHGSTWTIFEVLPPVVQVIIESLPQDLFLARRECIIVLALQASSSEDCQVSAEHRLDFPLRTAFEEVLLGDVTALQGCLLRSPHLLTLPKYGNSTSARLMTSSMSISTSAVASGIAISAVRAAFAAPSASAVSLANGNVATKAALQAPIQNSCSLEVPGRFIKVKLNSSQE